ncbi:3'(2'),5'-bisphosphate nucleotidase CysQ [Patiriisocius hiemis]|uniref:3'(2'),5'-bisphosphate nucleotidase CysQ n=1 Tax=Patiriisocius hiemis TaxID=3075604 RepID=A0ABU2YHT3_9FLAO|nr:3'(2'),5'-bisphosphate nucleotidase CysQ [Constantimarinum sp. W242]MDT0556633.1 3'(2'),5'-bisphosphate nucleotidase CysQ [Constantimarinum sp. W242]
MEKLLHTILQAAIEAGEAIMEVYMTDFDVEIKGDNSPLTIADKKANTVINKYLETTNIPIISEENKQTDYSVRKSWDRCWIVDPLDGTKEFVKRNGEFTVNIALVENGSPILGVIYVPVVRELYFTNAKGTSALKVTVGEKYTIEDLIKEAATISPDTSDASIVKIVGSRSHLNDDTKKFISEVEQKSPVEIVSKGSSLKFCLVAEGKANLYPRYAPTMEWDTAAGQAICNAVGVKVIDNTTQEALQYNKENLLNNYFLVTL